MGIIHLRKLSTHHWIQFISFILLCQVMGMMGLFFIISTGFSNNYPTFLPVSSWIYSPLWIAAYLIAVSIYSIILKYFSSIYKKSLSRFSIQFFINIPWIILFLSMYNVVPGSIIMLSFCLIILFIHIQFYILTTRNYSIPVSYYSSLSKPYRFTYCLN
ncbi:MAG: tryptophan-rich sensory protein [Cytophagales bacterium]|nr:tryptophan-rich sensory protein [Cytophaga sp.]